MENPNSICRAFPILLIWSSLHAVQGFLSVPLPQHMQHKTSSKCALWMAAKQARAEPLATRRSSLLTALAVGCAIRLGSPCGVWAEDSSGFEDLRKRLEEDPAKLIGTLPHPVSLPFAVGAKRQTFWPDWAVGEWLSRETLLEASFPQGSSPPRLRGGTLRGERESVGAQAQLLLRFARDDELGAVGSKQVVEDRGFNLMMEHQALGQEKVIQATYNTRTDPNTVTLKIDDGIDHNGRSFFQGDNEGRPSYIVGESLRDVIVGEKQVTVTDYEVITRFTQQPDGSILGQRRVIVLLCPDPVNDKLAKMRSAGSLRMWSTLTKITEGISATKKVRQKPEASTPLVMRMQDIQMGTVKEGKIGIDVSVRTKPLAVYDYAMELRKT